MRTLRKFPAYSIRTHYCPKCNKQVLHEVSNEWELETDGSLEEFKGKFVIYTCIVCDNVSWRRRT